MPGPAIGARGQIGFSQEGLWGKKQPRPTYFVEFKSETMVSEIGSLVSASMRPDRAVHKRIGGVEAAGGDLQFEVSAEGYGTLFKHALGLVETTRLDSAFVLKVTDGSATSAKLTITTSAGLATNFQVVITGGTGTGINTSLADTTSDTIQELMDLINAGGTGLAAYSASSYDADGTNVTTIQTADYANGTDNSRYLEGVSAVEIIENLAGSKDFLVCFGWGVFQHVIDANPTLPEGLTFEFGRDVAAFTYPGCKVNTLNITAETGDILAGTIGLMGLGATTVSKAIADVGNTGNVKNAFRIRYTGSAGSCTLAIDKTNHLLTIDSGTASEDLKLDISIPWIEPETGVVYPVHTVGGLVSYLNSLGYLTAYIAPYCDLDADSSYLANISATPIVGTSYVWFDFTLADLPSEPVTFGDYKGEDAGEALAFVAEIVGGGAPGTATIRFQASGGSWGDTYTTSATLPTEVRIAANVDTGFTIFFPDNSALQAGDAWVISSFKDEETGATYSTLDPYAGFDGALTMDGDTQPIMGWNCTLNNNLYADKYHLGSRTRASLPEQRRSVEGSVNVEFDNLDLYRRFVNGTPGNVVMTFTSDAYIANAARSAIGNSRSQFSLLIRQPNIEFNGATPTIEGEGIITVDMPYVALFDDINNIPEIRITLVNGESYL